MHFSFQSPHAVEIGALAATLLCVWACAFAAGRFRKESPRLLLAVALFGLNWAILLLYYIPGPPQNEILTTFSGLLLIYVGVLLLREAHERENGRDEAAHSWIDALPMLLFRASVGGFGVYLLVRQLFRLEYGYGTLALAFWGTLLTVLGYAVVAYAVWRLFAGSVQRKALTLWLAVLLGIYSLGEVTFAVWYAREAWPPYHRYLAAQASPYSPDFDEQLPFAQQPNWPEAGKWARLRSRSDWPQLRTVLRLQVTPGLPPMPPWLEWAFSVLKVLFTGTLLGSLWLRFLREENRGLKPAKPGRKRFKVRAINS